MLFVEKNKVLDHVHVYLITLETPTPVADQNACKTLNVRIQRLALIRNAVIRAQACVEIMLNASLSITLHHANVSQDILEILLLSVAKSQEVNLNDFFLQFQCSLLTYTHNYSDDYIPPVNPCQPSPCGPYSSCKIHDGHAVCSCLQGYNGSPPSCKPECSVSSDCSSNKACENERCIDPCPGTCGHDARCNVVNHSPICSCPPNYSGDPFVRCYKEERKTATNTANLTPKC